MRARLIEYPQPPEIGVRIWTAQLAALLPPELSALTALLDEAERKRAERFHFERDRQNYIAARGFLRQLVGAALAISPSLLRFIYGATGKPLLADGGLHFNVSHSGGWAMYAVAPDREVGIDLEAMTRLASDDEHLAALAARVLSARELDIWKKLPHAAARHAAFLRAWTRKEAYAKATGQGIFDGLRDVEVILDAAAPEQSLNVSRSSAGGAGVWTLHDLHAPDGFVASLAIAGS